MTYNYYTKSVLTPIFVHLKGETKMKEIISMVKGYVDDLVQLLMSLISIGVICEIIFGSGFFGVNVIQNITSIIGMFGDKGFVGLLALLILMGLYKK